MISLGQRIGRVAILVATAVLWSGTAHAGILETDDEGTKVYYDDGRIKFDIKEGTYVLDTVAGKVWVAAKQERLYAEGNIRQVCAAVGKALDEDRDQNRKHKNLKSKNELELSSQNVFVQADEPEVNVRNDMDGMGIEKVKIKMVGPGPKIAGRKTKQYSVTIGGIPYAEVWGSRDRDLVKEIRKMDYGVVSALERCGAGPISMIEDRDSQEDAVESTREYLSFQGTTWILRKRLYAGDDLEPPIIDTGKLKRVTLTDAQFKPPKSYKKIPIKKMVEMMLEESD